MVKEFCFFDQITTKLDLLPGKYLSPNQRTPIAAAGDRNSTPNS